MFSLPYLSRASAFALVSIRKSFLLCWTLWRTLHRWDTSFFFWFFVSPCLLQFLFVLDFDVLCVSMRRSCDAPIFRRNVRKFCDVTCCQFLAAIGFAIIAVLVDELKGQDPCIICWLAQFGIYHCHCRSYPALQFQSANGYCTTICMDNPQERICKGMVRERCAEQHRWQKWNPASSQWPNNTTSRDLGLVS